MRSTTKSPCASWFALAGFGLLVGACGGAMKSSDRGSTNMQAAMSPQESPTAAIVEIASELVDACNIPEQDATVGFDSSIAGDYPSLDRLASCFSMGAMGHRTLSLFGHADLRGAADYNMTLGQMRADAVAGYLLARGMGQTQVRSGSRGALDSASYDNTRARGEDRRVEIFLGP